MISNVVVSRSLVGVLADSSVNFEATLWLKASAVL